MLARSVVLRFTYSSLCIRSDLQLHGIIKQKSNFLMFPADIHVVATRSKDSSTVTHFPINSYVLVNYETQKDTKLHTAKHGPYRILNHIGTVYTPLCSKKNYYQIPKKPSNGRISITVEKLDFILCPFFVTDRMYHTAKYEV